jgi:type I restriction enzyme S subunit
VTGNVRWLSEMTVLFRNEQAGDSEFYRNLVNAETDWLLEARQFCEDLWKVYEPFADKHFLSELRRNFVQRFWEMYLTCVLLEHGLDVSCPKPGPDNLVRSESGRVWLEAIAPSGGDPSKLDVVPEYQDGVVQQVPDEQVRLRYTGAVQEKFKTRYFHHMSKGIVLEGDSYVVAMNASRINFSRSDLSPPRILRSLFGIGWDTVTFSKDPHVASEWGFELRPGMRKAKGAEVSLQAFLDPEYEALSAVLFSCVDPCNRPLRLGDDLILIHNPMATSPIRPGFLKLGVEYTAKVSDQKVTLHRKIWHDT